MRKLCLLLALLLALLAAAASAETTLDDFSGLPAFSPADGLGRAVSAFAVLSAGTLNPGNRTSLQDFTPTGFRSGDLWNRCHLLASQLAPGTDVAENLVTGTRAMNAAMQSLENRVARYLREHEAHVLYRVVPDFRADELVCRGVSIRIHSIEDDGLRLNVYIENAQDGYAIDYAVGDFGFRDDPAGDAWATYIVNTARRRFHLPDCTGVKDIAGKNTLRFTGKRSTLLARGLQPCGTCNP